MTADIRWLDDVNAFVAGLEAGEAERPEDENPFGDAPCGSRPGTADAWECGRQFGLTLGEFRCAA